MGYAPTGEQLPAPASGPPYSGTSSGTPGASAPPFQRLLERLGSLSTHLIGLLLSLLGALPPFSHGDRPPVSVCCRPRDWPSFVNGATDQRCPGWWGIPGSAVIPRRRSIRALSRVLSRHRPELEKPR